MKHILNITITILLALVASSCQNDGYIGDIFGTWKVESVSLDGQPAALRFPTTFSFQNSVVEVVALTDDYMGNSQRFGSWERNAESITLNFTHHDDSRPAGTSIYEAPAWLGMSSDTKIQMTCTISGRSMDWTWHSPAGVYNYKLVKAW